MTRSVNFCMMNPVIGITTAIVSMKLVVSHCATSAEIPKSTISTGSATASVVSLRITTNAAATRIPMSSRAFTVSCSFLSDATLPLLALTLLLWD